MPIDLAAPRTNALATTRIGIFDSGLGGLSVLREVRRALPGSTCHYVADSGHAPYGEREEGHVLDRSHRVARHLVEHGAKLIVVACNTATAIAVASLRDRWPGLPIVGLEPGLKPALAATRNGRIGVMATHNTLASAKFAALLACQPEPQCFHLQACDGLAAAIETLPLDDRGLNDRVASHVAPLRRAEVDTIVLGCTHYAFVAAAIRSAAGARTVLIDTAQAVARQAARLAGAAEASPCGPCASSTRSTQSLRLETTGDPVRLRNVALAWLGVDGVATATRI
jgi:glutamate racemase